MKIPSFLNAQKSLVFHILGYLYKKFLDIFLESLTRLITDKLIKGFVKEKGK